MPFDGLDESFEKRGLVFFTIFLSKPNLFSFPKNNLKQIGALIGLLCFFKLDRITELSRAVHVMMTRAKIIYILMIEVNKLFFFLS